MLDDYDVDGRLDIDKLTKLVGAKHNDRRRIVASCDDTCDLEDNLETQDYEMYRFVQVHSVYANRS